MQYDQFKDCPSLAQCSVDFMEKAIICTLHMLDFLIKQPLTFTALRTLGGGGAERENIACIT